MLGSLASEPIKRRPGLLKRWLIVAAILLTLALLGGALFNVQQRYLRLHAYHADLSRLYALPLSFQNQQSMLKDVGEMLAKRNGKAPTGAEIAAEWFGVTTDWTRRAAYHASLSAKYQEIVSRPGRWFRVAPDPPPPPVRRAHPAVEAMDSAR